jgi:hypothetical protein
LSRPIIPASAANRVATTESLRAEAINHFRNKICHKRTYALQQNRDYSITSSAMASTPGGIVSPHKTCATARR